MAEPQTKLEGRVASDEWRRTGFRCQIFVSDFELRISDFDSVRLDAMKE